MIYIFDEQNSSLMLMYGSYLDIFRRTNSVLGMVIGFIVLHSSQLVSSSFHAHTEQIWLS